MARARARARTTRRTRTRRRGERDEEDEEEDEEEGEGFAVESGGRAPTASLREEGAAWEGGAFLSTVETGE